jgi:putative serine protease PepD
MTTGRQPSLGSVSVDPDFGLEDEGPFFAWLPPEDRLWRHPSENPPLHSAGGRHPESSGSGEPDAEEAGEEQPPGPTDPTKELAAARIHPTRTWAVALVAGVVGAMVASGFGFASGVFGHNTTVIKPVFPTVPTLTLAASPADSVTWRTVAQSIEPFVVAIAVSGASPQMGSGTLISLGGDTGESYVVTDRSLLTPGEAADDLGSIQVTYVSGQQVQGHLVGQDPLSGLAVIAVPTSRAILPRIGSVSGLQVADPVMAVGAEGDGSVFPGSVSAEDREVDLASGGDLDNLIAVSGTLPAPDQGGPLVDQSGEVVGITVGVNSADPSDQDLTFAIPIDDAVRVTEQILAGDTLTHPWLGTANTVDLTSAAARELGVQGGARPETVAPNSPASRIGITPRDIITTFDGQPVTSTGTLTALLAQCRPGQSVSISFIHDGKTTTGTVVIVNEPNDS